MKPGTRIHPRPAVLFVGSRDSVFVERTADALQHRGFRVQIFDPRAAVAVPAHLHFGPLPSALIRAVVSVTRLHSFDPSSTAVIHGLGIDVAWMAPLLKRRFSRVVGIAYGSDILRRPPSRDWALEIGLSALDQIAATNQNVIRVIKEAFPRINPERMSITRFGLPVIEELASTPDSTAAFAKSKLGLRTDRATIALGYCASVGQRQLELINSLSRQHARLGHLQFVVPIQYGAGAVQAEVRAACASANSICGQDAFVAIEEFYDVPRSALMRRATDVLINHSISDSFSGTVTETVFAGNLIFAAKHLPYGSMPGAGQAIQFYESVSELPEMLQASNLASLKMRAHSGLEVVRTQLLDLASWDGVMPQWIQFLSGSAEGPP